MSAKFETMILRLRQVLTVLLLLLFSLENMANASTEAGSEKYAAHQHISAQKENLTLFSWVIEENENEERNDDKVHGITTHFAYASPASPIHPSISRTGQRLFDLSSPTGSQQILKLICRLRI